jgi:hypothetical protein
MDNIREATLSLRSALLQPHDVYDPIQKCGPALLTIQKYPEEVQRLAHSRLHAFPFKDVPAEWIRLYCEATLWMVYYKLKSLDDDWSAAEEVMKESISETVRLLDMTLIMTGGSGRRDLIFKVLEQLSGVTLEDSNGPNKRRKITKGSEVSVQSKIPHSFPESSRSAFPPIKQPILRMNDLTLEQFQNHLDSSHIKNQKSGTLPIIITSSITEWPAMSTRKWSDPEYLLSRTIGGQRIVPVEIGRSYTDEGWGQKLLPLRQFMEENMFVNYVPSEKRGYLAQHDIFTQIPALRDDVQIPDYCYSEPPSQHKAKYKDSEDGYSDGEVALNAWFGPAHTVSPAHTDPHHNILAQVVGHKYVRLFSPDQTIRMAPKDLENGVDMSNTSRVEVGLAMRLFEDWQGWNEKDEDEMDIQEAQEDFELKFPIYRPVCYVEGIIGPGDCLFIPKGWWHYVHSLSPSFSVSFWWD